MQRRALFRTMLAGVGLAAFNGGAKAATPDPAKVAYHLSDLDKVAFVLGNIQNHLAGVGGPDKVRIVLVVHGPALKAFERASGGPETSSATAALTKAGVALQACANTLRAYKLQVGDLLAGFTVADKGGVVRLAELQGQGYVYLRP